MISIVVPCYNEAEALPHFLDAFSKAVAAIEAYTFELILVNDGSGDGTLSLCHAAMERMPFPVRVLSFSRNFGKEAALLAGLRETRGDLVSVMDADLQDPPSLLPQMLALWEETGCDCVATRRVTRSGEPRMRSMFARAFYRLMQRISSAPVADGVRDFRLMTREMTDAILSMPESRRFSKGIFAWVGFDVRYIPYENVARVAGVTKWSFWGLLRYALEGVFNFSNAPLAIAPLCGALCLIACLVMLPLGLWVAALACLLAGIVLLAMGVLGQYVARIFIEAKGRPLYIEKKGGSKG